MTNRNEWLIPGAIILVGFILAVSVYLLNHHATTSSVGNVAAMRPVSSTDHIIGNPAAPVVFVEYADVDSEYAKDFEQVMEQVMQTYGSGGQVAWVYRAFPLIGVDEYSEEHAEAAECVAAGAGAQNSSAAFFKFIDALQAAAPGENDFNPRGYDDVISQLGYSVTDFNTCLADGTYKSRVMADYENALAIGADGSPYTVLIVKGQSAKVISGAVPYSTLKQVIDSAISDALGSTTSATGN
ncbi:MAG: thioredoxin domain-containing protein [Candidatus Pacebacteria bacterium]|nr:thioredoxin domain-containing protein [Candidatus Paceibacterota bacterium]